jgi:riboflavin synthase
MFTGIIHHTAKVSGVTATAAGVRISLASPFSTEVDPVRHGDSIAICGVCLTVAELTPGLLHFDAIPETLAKTNLGRLGVGDKVHLERSLRAGDRVDGHFVQGHVDGTAELVAVRTEGEWRMTCRAPADLLKYIVPKGSVALDGVSLTYADVRGDTFDIALIPTTLELTELGRRPLGYRFNLECDPLAKTIVTFLERMGLSDVVAARNLGAKDS